MHTKQGKGTCKAASAHYLAYSRYPVQSALSIFTPCNHVATMSGTFWAVDSRWKDSHFWRYSKKSTQKTLSLSRHRRQYFAIRSKCSANRIQGEMRMVYPILSLLQARTVYPARNTQKEYSKQNADTIRSGDALLLRASCTQKTAQQTEQTHCMRCGNIGTFCTLSRFCVACQATRSSYTARGFTMLTWNTPYKLTILHVQGVTL